MKLRTKFFILLMLFASLFMGYVHLLWLPTMKQQIVQLAKSDYQSHLHTTAEALVPLLLENQLANAFETLDAVKQDNPHWISLTLHTVRGERLYPLFKPDRVTESEEIIKLYESVGFMQPYLGELTLVVDLSPALQAANELQYSLGLVLALMMTAFLLGIALEVEFLVRRPLARLVHASRELAVGHYNTALPLNSRDEIGELAFGFAEMRNVLQKYHIDMAKEVDRHRRKADDLERKRAEADYLATHDSLTGLVNRREFEYRLNSALDEALAYGESHALLFIDLDYFKSVNDKCGHDAGDELLKEVVALIDNLIRDKDTLARIGGDEFALILHSCTGHDAVKIGNKICSEVAQYRFYWEGSFFNIGASIGIAPFEEGLTTTKTWIKHADAACYVAKGSGRGCARLYDSGEI